MQRSLYLWLTDSHIFPWDRYSFLNSILDQKPKGVFLTGDISNSAQTLIGDLKFLGPRIGRPLYFVIGNHDLHFSNINQTHEEIRNLCRTYKNLVWMDEVDFVPLTDEACCIGGMGWYDCRVGNPEYVKYTMDWFLIDDFRYLISMDERISKFRQWAEKSAREIGVKLEAALKNYKTVYLLSHFPAWREANRASHWLSDAFWEPYNTNLILGETLETIMEKHKNRQLICFFGHTHLPVTIHVSRNIECRVGHGSFKKLSEKEILYI